MQEVKEMLRTIKTRIANKQCPICGKEITEEFEIIEDKCLLADDLIKVCKTHPINVKI